jgi:hypothetical protein
MFESDLKTEVRRTKAEDGSQKTEIASVHNLLTPDFRLN